MTEYDGMQLILTCCQVGIVGLKPALPPWSITVSQESCSGSFCEDWSHSD